MNKGNNPVPANPNGVRYVADSLTDVAETFEVYAEQQEANRTLGTAAVRKVRAQVWREAAALLRKTTLRTQKEQSVTLRQLMDRGHK